MEIKINYVGLLNRLEQKTGEAYSDRYVSKASGVRRPTLIDMRYERLKGVSLSTLEKLGDFFVTHGLDIEPSDLLTNA